MVSKALLHVAMQFLRMANKWLPASAPHAVASDICASFQYANRAHDSIQHQHRRLDF